MWFKASSALTCLNVPCFLQSDTTKTGVCCLFKATANLFTHAANCVYTRENKDVTVTWYSR